MDFSRPPRNYEELCMWKVFVCTTKNLESWTVINRWVKKYGNPFIMPEEEDYESANIRRTFRDALQFCYTKK